MNEILTMMAVNGAALAVFMLGQWLASLRLGDVSIVDRFWGTGFVLVAVVSLVVSREVTAFKLMLLAMVTIWGLRLSLYLTWRNWGTDEDFRYQSMRKRFGPKFKWTSLYIVFGLQGFLTWFISLPLQVGMAAPGGTTVEWVEGSGIVTYIVFPFGPEARVVWIETIGMAIWAIGFAFECIGDWQLARFKANPENKGQVLDTGLWRYTRHPNYFGDALLWWGMYVYVVRVPFGAWTVLSPIVMTFFLMRVSGVTLLERSLKKRKPKYAEYVERTNAFFPWWPKGT